MCFYFHLAIIVFVKEYRKGQLLYHSCSRHIPTLETLKRLYYFPSSFTFPLNVSLAFFRAHFFQHKRSAFSSTWRRKNLLSFANAKIYFFSVSVFRTRTSRPIRNGSESPSLHSFLYIYRLNIHAGMDVFVMELRNVCSAETALIRFTK
jgi:hypothetical protein